MQVRITYADNSTRDVTIADAAILNLAVRQADIDDERERDKQKKQPLSVKAL